MACRACAVAKHRSTCSRSTASAAGNHRCQHRPGGWRLASGRVLATAQVPDPTRLRLSEMVSYWNGGQARPITQGRAPSTVIDCDFCGNQARSMRVVGAGEVVDMVGSFGEPGAESIDETLQALKQYLVAGVEGGQPLSRGFGLLGKRRKINAYESAVHHQHFAANHDRMHRAAVFSVYQLISRVVAGDPVDVREVEEDEVGFVSLGNSAEFVGKAERAGAARGGSLKDLFALEPAIGVGSFCVGAVGSDAERLIHVLIVAARGPVRTNADVELPVQHAADSRDTIAEQHVAARIVSH